MQITLEKEIDLGNSMRKKFLFITDNTSSLIPVRYLGPYRLADSLEQVGVETYIIDHLYRFPNFFEYLENILDESFVGIGISTTFLTSIDNISRPVIASQSDLVELYYNNGIISTNKLKRKLWFNTLKKIMIKINPEMILFLGGVRANIFYLNDYSDIDEVDYFVMGSCDNFFSKIVIDLIKKKEIKYETYLGLKICSSKNYTENNFTVCPKHSWKKTWCIQPNEPLPIEIGRGCAFNCKFCNYDKDKNIKKSPSDLKNELIENYEKFGTKYYQFVDDCFNDSRRKVEEVCNLLLSLPFKIEWVSYMRFDVAVKFPETMDLIVESGGRGFLWGVESLTYEVARRAGKGTHPDKIKDFMMSFSKKYRKICYSGGSFIVGLPGETELTWKDQMKWLGENQIFNFIHVGPLMIAQRTSSLSDDIIDFAEYSINPEKFGFTKVTFNPHFWKHLTMDSKIAKELALWSIEHLKANCELKEGISNSIWHYPVFKSLGLSQNEVFKCYHESLKSEQEVLRLKIQSLIKDRNQSYFQDMNSLFKYNT